MNEKLLISGLVVERGARQILRGVDLEIAPGRICALMGASGSGKSTALRAIVALEPFSAGSVRLGKVTLAPGPVPPESRLREFRRQIGETLRALARDGRGLLFATHDVDFAREYGEEIVELADGRIVRRGAR